MALLDGAVVSEQQSTDQRKLARVVKPNNRDTPSPFVERDCFDLNQVVWPKLVSKRGMAPDFVGREYLGVGGIHARDVRVVQVGADGSGFVPTVGCSPRYFR